jgi:P pilus assembly chaperone PapD
MRAFFLILTLLATFISGYANATFYLSTTRIIHHEYMKESSFEVYNTSDDEILIQGWLSADKSELLPFAMTPPLVKIAPQKSNMFRIFYEGSGLPKDRESLIWVNVLAIPMSSKVDDSLQVALQQSIKLFYRPSNLSGDARIAPELLMLSLKDNLLVVRNTTPYHVNIISFRQNGVEFEGDMIPPYGESSISATGINGNGNIEVVVINDFGGEDTFEGVLSNGKLNKFKIKNE